MKFLFQPLDPSHLSILQSIEPVTITGLISRGSLAVSIKEMKGELGNFKDPEGGHSAKEEAVVESRLA